MSDPISVLGTYRSVSGLRPSARTDLVPTCLSVDSGRELTPGTSVFTSEPGPGEGPVVKGDRWADLTTGE